MIVSYPTALDETLARIVRVAHHFRDDWWIIGSAAARLFCPQIDDPNDIDLLVSLRDAENLFELWNDVAYERAPASSQFRSGRFRRYTGTPLPVEVFADFDIRIDGVWTRYAPQTRVSAARGLFTSDLRELICLYEAMDRDKDKAKIASLKERLMQTPRP